MTSAGVVSFIARHLLAAIVTAGGLLLAGLGYAQQGYELWQGGVEAWQLQAAGFLVFAVAVIAMLYRWDNERRSSSANDSPSESAVAAVSEIHNVTSHNQSGGITAYTVNQAPTPELRCGPPASRQNPDGTHTITCNLDVVAPYPPAELYLQVEAAGVVSLDVSPNRTGVFMTGHSGIRDGRAFTSLVNPSGRYSLRAVAAEPTIRIGYRFS